MRRGTISPRTGWQSLVESQGLHYHTEEGVPYWDESVYYELTSSEVDTLEKATYELNRLCLEAVQVVIDEERWESFLIPEKYIDFIVDSWERDEVSIYGRFDLAFDGTSPPKLLEFNADTPTGLLEAAVVQWFWLRDQFFGKTQFNSLHDRLIEAWKLVRSPDAPRLIFASHEGHVEDVMTVQYLRDTAMQAGWQTEYLPIEQIGWSADDARFVDLEGHAITHCFKLYPWEFLFRDEFGEHLLEAHTRWFEPAWKAILSNKSLLPLLWELFPRHENLLEASFDPLRSGNYAVKPVLGREGANVRLYRGGQPWVTTDGPYDGEVIYQALHPLPQFDGAYACIGSWMVNGWSCGIGIREDHTPITGNLSRFVPHVING